MTNAFKTWLEENHYRPNTARMTLTYMNSIRKQYEAGEVLSPKETFTDTRGLAIRRYNTFLHETGQQDGFDEMILDLGLAPITRKLKAKRGRKRRATSFADEDWKKLDALLWESDTPESTVLLLQQVTGYRIGDILNITKKAFTAAFRDGVLTMEVKGGENRSMRLDGAPDVWARLKDRWTEGVTIAHWVCPRGKTGGAGAYLRVDRYLKKQAKTLGIEGRAHTHRFRRTVATRALKTTGDIHLVQQLLGHSSIQSTQSYVDEPRLDEVAKLQRSLRKKPDGDSS